VCKDEGLRQFVNKLLGMGLTRPSIMEILDSTVNVEREGNDKITYHNLRLHQQKHFDTSRAAGMIYESIVQQRAIDNDPDVVERTGAAVNAMSYLEVVMLKGWSNLIDENTVVPFDVGAKAAVQLHEMTRKDAGSQQIAELIARQNRIIAAVQEFVPQEQIPAMLARIDAAPGTVIEAEVSEVTTDEPDFDDEDDDDDEY